MIEMHLSHPTRVRGLKYRHTLPLGHLPDVAPHEGAWIEIACRDFQTVQNVVAPHEGAWIEISIKAAWTRIPHCRTPRGCVD